MLLKTPKFWFKNKNEKNLFSFLLSPLSKIWELTIRHRINKGLWKKMSVPVICVGNLIVGGSGKTPVTISLQIILKEMGIKACVVTRGYGGKHKGPIYVGENDSSIKVGDEPILLSKRGSVIVSKNKINGINKAFNDGFDVVLLDDGFQNTQIKKDFSLVVIDSKILFGNELIIPSGPLREPIQSGLSRADAIILVTYKDRAIPTKLDLGINSKTPIFEAFIEVDDQLKNLKDERVLGFSGIAHPDKFFNTLEGLGCNLVKSVKFSDHYQYKNDDIIKLKRFAKTLNAKLVTTEKDFSRIPIKFQNEIKEVKIAIKFKKEQKIKNKLRSIIYQ